MTDTNYYKEADDPDEPILNVQFSVQHEAKYFKRASFSIDRALVEFAATHSILIALFQTFVLIFDFSKMSFYLRALMILRSKTFG